VTEPTQPDLIARLLSMHSHRGDGLPTQHVNPDGPAAVAEIERLNAEIERVRVLNYAMKNTLATYSHQEYLANKARRKLMLMRLIRPWFIAYAIVALVTFAISASDPTRTCVRPRICTLNADAAAGSISAAFWPLYWSWELAERARGAP
jgi:hypothetical protein